MIGTVFTEKYGMIKYEESFWTGSKKILIGNVYARKQGKKLYTFVDKNEKEVDVELIGNFMIGVKLLIDGEEYQVIPQTKWYEYCLSIFSFIFILIWGNIPTSVDIFPVVGGAIGGLISAALAVVSLSFMKKTNKPIYKILIGLLFLVVTLLIAHLAAKMILSL